MLSLTLALSKSAFIRPIRALLNVVDRRFLHGTWVGSKVTHGVWKALENNSVSRPLASYMLRILTST